MTRTPTATLFLIALALLASAPSAAQQLPIRRAPELSGEPHRIDVRAVVDGQTDFFVRSARVRYETQSGRPPEDTGSTYTAALPAGAVSGLEVNKLEGRGDVILLEQPTELNDWTLRFRISDTEGGDDRYHVRISWDGPRAVSQTAPTSGGRMDELSATADGRGFLRSVGRADDLSTASVSLIPGGRAIVSFPGVSESRFEGTWSYANANRIDLTINQAMGTAATGRGEIRMRGDRFTEIDMEGSTAGGRSFEATFEQSGDYQDFVNPDRSTSSGSSQIRAPRPGRPAAPAPGRGRRDAPRRRATPAISELSRSFTGEGDLDASRIGEDDVEEVFVRLREDGEARLELDGDEYWTVEGRWSHSGSAIVTIGLTAIEGEPASGAAKLTVNRKPGGEWDVEQIEIDGNSRKTGDFQVRMRIR